MKGIVLAGGYGTRLRPLTNTISKQMLPVYDKPMVYYPISVLMLAGIKEILIISSPRDLPHYRELLGTGEKLGMKFWYAEQKKPRGIAESFMIAENFIGEDRVCLILGDNIFYGQGFKETVQSAGQRKKGATIFGYYVNDPERYGVVEFDKERRVISLEEKPDVPKSPYAVTGLYFYDNDVVSIAKKLKPSARGELEITDVNKEYMKRDDLFLEIVGRGVAWLDTGTHESLMEAGQYIEVIEKRQGLKIGCLEEIAYRMGFIDIDQFRSLGREYESSSYGSYILHIADQLSGKDQFE